MVTLIVVDVPDIEPSGFGGAGGEDPQRGGPLVAVPAGPEPNDGAKAEEYRQES
ncbi:hypothetical protein [Kitasatospora sp. NPDC056184]|uniref:hypothetical protein n=1 Tax=Kitasatospora sp. NPDC056184 TaxID=3345738 RepID=UPI0035D7D939